ncbi:MAG TPA: glycerol-3-phosphate 1-O-acyltransferase PlsY [Gemmataceae bacterium]|jgi:acyl-phosphate glycerol 3-phosphate acyltransferase|nr:glycerol-3-phosphate 1-O-acyltransferase PlsY [Gemmataceae bacterium]
MLIAACALVAAYLIGSVPFGWLIARARGINIFAVGSGNIGATNVGRVLGKKFAILVFALDFAKGAMPVAVVSTLPTETQNALGLPDALRVGVALGTFLGHLFPVYLGFRGGKGAATGAGTVFVLVPGPAAIAVLTFAAMLGASRVVSVGSIAAAIMLCACRLLSVDDPLGRQHVMVTGFCIIGSAVMILKHRANIHRLWVGTENRMDDKPMLHTLTRAIHVISLGVWFGSAVMFNLIVAPTQFFEAFPAVVESAPSDRTANLPLAPGASEDQKKQLATALAGSAVGPVFPKFFKLQAVCAALALVTALAWWQRRGRVHRCRVILAALAATTIAVGWPLSNKVSALRVERFDVDPATAEAARTAFSEWHLASLMLSFVTLVLAGLTLTLAAKMPEQPGTSDYQAAR